MLCCFWLSVCLLIYFSYGRFFFLFNFISGNIMNVTSRFPFWNKDCISWIPVVLWKECSMFPLIFVIDIILWSCSTRCPCQDIYIRSFSIYRFLYLVYHAHTFVKIALGLIYRTTICVWHILRVWNFGCLSWSVVLSGYFDFFHH